MGKTLLFLVATTILTTGVLLYTGTQRSALEAEEQLSEQAAQLLARQVALTAMSEARAAFLSDAERMSQAASAYSGTYEGGAYRTSIAPEAGASAPTVRIQVEGRMPFGNGEMAGHTIETTYRLSGGGGGSVSPPTQVPSFMAYGMLVDGDLDLRGNMDTHGRDTLNASVHTNGKLSVGGNATVQGFGTYVVSSELKGNARFAPRHNPGGLPPVHQVSRIEIPPFNIEDHLPLATPVADPNTRGGGNQGGWSGGSSSGRGDWTWSGNDPITLGTPDSPAIWHVPGDLKVNGNTRISGYGIILVEGNVHINGNTRMSSDNNTHLAIYTKGNAKLNGNTTIHGNLFIDGELEGKLNGNSTLYGSITARRSSLKINGNFDLHYRQVPPVLTEPIWPSDPAPGEQAWRATNYREWASQAQNESIR